MSARLVFRHPLVIRLAHWVNAVVLGVLLMSGLQIFNAHPALAISSTGDDPERGYVQAFGKRLDTTGVLGLSNVQGEPTARAFPAWITLPAEQDLATGRRWHFLFAWIFAINGLIYLAYGLASGQLRARMIPTGPELRHIGATVVEHLRLRFPKDEAATRYNVLQKLTYFAVALVLLPLQILAGLAMSPGFTAFAPWLPEVFGGRQSARTVHFVIATLLVLFLLVHLAMVLLSGPLNNLRGMITGWFAIHSRETPKEETP